MFLKIAVPLQGITVIKVTTDSKLLELPKLFLVTNGSCFVGIELARIDLLARPEFCR